MEKKLIIGIKLTALLVALAIVFTTIPFVATAQKSTFEEEKPAYIVGEIESMRTETEKVFKMSDGKMQLGVYNSPVHFKNEDGQWEEINNDLKSLDTDTYTTKNTAQDISLSKKYKSGKTVEITTNNTSISWGFVGANKASAEIVEQETEKLNGDDEFTAVPNASSTTIYKDIYDNIDAEYIITGGQIKENLILNKKIEQNEFKIEYRYKKLTPVQKADKTIELQNPKGKTVYTITAPIMTDESGAFSDALKLEIVSNKNNKLTVNLVADKDWLQAKDRKYPIVIDPQISLSDTYMQVQVGPMYKEGENSEGNSYNSALSFTLRNAHDITEGAYITNALLRVFFQNEYNGELPLYFMAAGEPTWSYLNYKVTNGYADDIDYVDSGDHFAEWDITKTIQSYGLTSNIVFAAPSESSDIYMQLGYNEVGSSFYIQPTMQFTYTNQSGINDNFSYHEFDLEEAGTLYLNDLNNNIIIRRSDLTNETSTETVDIGMTYTTDFNCNIGAAVNYYWKPHYYQSVSYYPNNSYYKYVWNTDDGEVIYFSESATDTNNETYFFDENVEGYSLYNTTANINGNSVNIYKIITPDSMVFEFAQVGRSEYTQNEKLLTKIYQKDGESSALEIEYNSTLRISKLTDSDGNEYIYNYDENNSDLLTSVVSADETVTYTYNNQKLVAVTTDKGTINYEYSNNSYENYDISAIILPNDYKLTLNETSSTFGRTITEYGYNSQTNNWVKGNRIALTRYPFKTVYDQLDAQDNITYTEVYYFDKNGYLASVSNAKGYALNQNADEKGNVFANTDITIPVVNLINDSSFEKSTSDWSLTNASIQTKTDTVNNAYFGKKWLEINNTSISTAKATQTITGLSSGTYTFSAYVKTAENSTIELNENNTIYDGVSIRATVGGTTKKATGISGKYEDWTRVYVTFDVSADNSSVNLELGLYNGKGNIYIDAVQLEKHKRAYDYNTVKNADFSNSTAWTTSAYATYTNDGNSQNSLDSKVLKLTGKRDRNVTAEQVLDLSCNQKGLSVSAWVSTMGMLPDTDSSEEKSKISVIGINNGVETVLGVKEIDYTLDSTDGFGGNSFYKIITPIDDFTTEYNTYKLRIEYNEQQGYMLVDGVEVMSGVMNISETEDDTNTDTETDTEIEVEEPEDYEIEDGYTIVSLVNSCETQVEECPYLTQGYVVYNKYGGRLQLDSTAYIGNSFAVTQNKDKYEYTDSNGTTKTTGGIWIGGNLDKTTQSGIRFWYRTDAACTISLRSATYGKGGTYDYIKTLPAAPLGAWVTFLYKDIETSKRKITDFKYMHIKITTATVYIDEVHTVLADSLIYKNTKYNIADATVESNNNYPITDEYVYSCMVQDFENYTLNNNISYFEIGSAENAYSGKSFGVTANKDKYEFIKDDVSYTVSGVEFNQNIIDFEKHVGIRFWYKSNKQWRISLRTGVYGSTEDYDKIIPASSSGQWHTIMFEDIEIAGKSIEDFNNIFIKTMNSSCVYIDEIHLLELADEYYEVSENYESARDGQTIKTVNATKRLTLNGKLCTINRETSSLGTDVFTTFENKTGNKISVTDGNGNVTNYSYNDLNNLVKISQTRNSTSVDVICDYNNKSELSTLTNGYVTYTYKYTAFGDLKSISVGSVALITYTYISNQDRRVSKLTYANGHTVNYNYNADDMIMSVVYKDGNNNVTDTVTYTNDEVGKTLEITDSANQTATLTYLEETQVWNIDKTEFLFSYSSSDENSSESINGKKFITSYSSQDNTSDTTALETSETTTFGNLSKTVYSDAFGRITKEEFKNNNKTILLKEYQYTSNGAYTSNQVKSVSTITGDSQPKTIRYTYDNNENITGIFKKTGDETETTFAVYEYDELNQLVKENDNVYTYDNHGNILTANTKYYSYGNGSWGDVLTAYNGNSITYDSNGNPTSYLGATLSWINGSQLKKYEKDALSLSCKYNVDGLRTEKTINANDEITTYNYYWFEDKLIHQKQQNEYIHFWYSNSNKIIGFTYYDGSVSSNYIYLKNTQEDVIGIIDENGNIVASYAYDALGNLLNSSGSMAQINPIRYRSYYYDAEINMYYLQKRYYDPVVGRFINANDIESITLNEDSQNSTITFSNLFSYCDNNWLTFSAKAGGSKSKIIKKVAVIVPNEEFFANEPRYGIRELKRIYNTDVGIIRFANSMNDFAKAWNNLPDCECVVIMSHGDYSALSTHSKTVIADLRSVSFLSYKNHHCLIVLGCDTANYAYKWNNIAYSISKKISGTVLASDGIVSVGFSDVENTYVYSSTPVNTEYGYTNNLGWVVYINVQNNIIWQQTMLPKDYYNGDFIVYRSISITTMINYLEKNNLIIK